jgi:hypothetical protein
VPSFRSGLVQRLVAASVTFVAVFTTIVGAAPGASPRVDELLPDMRAVAPYDVRTSGDGKRFVIGFGSTSQNVGDAALKMRGSRASSASLTMSADQLVALKNGKERVYSGAGTFAYITEETHRHWHWLGFMRYELRRVTDLSLVNPDVKSGFCVADRQPVSEYNLPADFPDPSWCEQDNPAATELLVGMSVGWGDPYKALIEGQEIARSRAYLPARTTSCTASIRSACCANLTTRTTSRLRSSSSVGRAGASLGHKRGCW